MAIDPKKAGQCWSCKYCEDIGTHTFEDYVTYIRQCNKPGHDYVDKCEHRCSDYVWDGTHREFWRPEVQVSPSPAASTPKPAPVPSKSETSAKSNPAVIRTVLIVIAALVVICVALFLITRREPMEAKDPHPSETSQTDPQEETTPNTKPEDYSLAGEKRIVRTESGNGLNLRENPSTDAVVITAIPDNQIVTIQKTVGSWAYISCEGESGWCSMDYLITEEEHAQVLETYLNIPAIVATESSPLRLREMPSTNSESIESMPKGSEVTVLKLEGQWAYVEYKGICGWCASEYLEMQGVG